MSIMKLHFVKTITPALLIILVLFIISSNAKNVDNITYKTNENLHGLQNIIKLNMDDTCQEQNKNFDNIRF